MMFEPLEAIDHYSIKPLKIAIFIVFLQENKNKYFSLNLTKGSSTSFVLDHVIKILVRLATQTKRYKKLKLKQITFFLTLVYNFSKT